MSVSLRGQQQEFRRRSGICLVASRLGIAALALLAAIFPTPVRAFQVTAFHPLAPTRPPARSMRPPTAPVASKPAGEPAKARGNAKSMSKVTPQMRKRIAEEMKREAAHRNSPPSKKIGR